MTDQDRYAAAGVDIEKGNELVRRIGQMVRATHGPQVLTGLGGFSGLYGLDTAGLAEPVLVSGTDGVGTKLKLAFLLGKHDTIGIDMVAMCVNDVVVCGAKPLFMLDYLATGKLELGVAEDVIAGVVEGCRQAGCALIGGETAEMPGFYPPGEYDLAGFVVGLVDKASIIDGGRVMPGAALVGLRSSGVHSNGFSLVRKIVLEEAKADLAATPAGLDQPLGLALLEPTRIYVKAVLAVRDRLDLLAAAHITGGGLLENIPRVLPEGCRAVLWRSAWSPPPILGWLREAGGLSQREMTRTFNAGLGMVLAVPTAEADQAVDLLRGMGEDAAVVGEVDARAPGQDAVEIAP